MRKARKPLVGGRPGTLAISEKADPAGVARTSRVSSGQLEGRREVPRSALVH